MLIAVYCMATSIAVVATAIVVLLLATSIACRTGWRRDILYTVLAIFFIFLSIYGDVRGIATLANLIVVILSTLYVYKLYGISDGDISCSICTYDVHRGRVIIGFLTRRATYLVTY
jgi:Na+/alanine symporter